LIRPKSWASPVDKKIPEMGIELGRHRASLEWTVRGRLSPQKPFLSTIQLWEFQGYEFGGLGAGVGDRVGVVAGEPFGVAGLHFESRVAGHGALRSIFVVALHIPADVAFSEIEVGDGYEQVRAGVVVRGDDAAGLEFEFGGADAVFDEEDFFSPALQDVEAAVFIILAGVPLGVPLSSGITKRFVLEDFDGDVAEGLIGDVARDVGEGGGGETSFAVLEFDGDGRLVLDGVNDLGGAENDVDVVVTVPVHQGFGVRVDFDVEDADGFVFEGQMVMTFGYDFNFRGGGLRDKKGYDEAE
jgi:hypothetical protein